MVGRAVVLQESAQSGVVVVNEFISGHRSDIGQREISESGISAVRRCVEGVGKSGRLQCGYGTRNRYAYRTSAVAESLRCDGRKLYGRSIIGACHVAVLRNSLVFHSYLLFKALGAGTQ